MRKPVPLVAVVLASTFALAAPAVPHHASTSDIEALGRRLFFDRDLSASHQLACASCHDPAYAYGPPNDRAVQLGGIHGDQQGQRAVPSLRYLQTVPVFTEHYFDEDIDESVDNGPTGGLTWDGRVQNPHEQARLPLLSPLEMANQSPEAVVTVVRASNYAAEFRRVFGARVFDDPVSAFDAITRALEVFQDDPAEFFPYTSKYDAYLRKQTKLTDQESRGLALFQNPAKGNCSFCHHSEIGSSGAFPAFTDFGYVALGVPRNHDIAANADPTYFDLGLCGPLRTDLHDHPEYCGMFRAPTLRNVALRRVFFHNGVFHSIDEVMHFYVERDLRPDKWYAHDTAGHVVPYDDLPERYRANLNDDPPFNRHPGDGPALTDGEIADVIAFLNTLTDGWSASAP